MGSVGGSQAWAPKAFTISSFAAVGAGATTTSSVSAVGAGAGAATTSSVSAADVTMAIAISSTRAVKAITTCLAAIAASTAEFTSTMISCHIASRNQVQTNRQVQFIVGFYTITGEGAQDTNFHWSAVYQMT